MEVAIKFYRNNRRYQIVKTGGEILHTSGLCVNSDSAFNNAKRVCTKNNWIPVRVSHQ